MLRSVCIIIVAALLPLPALAAHPLVTDDTGTQGDGRLVLEVNGALGRERAAGALDEAAELASVLSLGAGDAVDLVVGVPLAWSRSRAGGAVLSETLGPADATLELKWRFLELGGFSLAVKPGLSLPTGDPGRGLGAGRPGLGLTLVASQALGPIALHVNGGYARQEHALPADAAAPRHDAWSASAALVADVSRRLQLVANVGVESPAERGATTWPAFLLAGALWAASDSLSLDVGVRTALDGAVTDLAFLAGASWRFGSSR